MVSTSEDSCFRVCMRLRDASARARVWTLVSCRYAMGHRDASHVHVDVEVPDAEVPDDSSGHVCTPLVLDELAEGGGEADAEGMGEVDLEVCTGVEHADVHVDALVEVDSARNVAGRMSTFRVTGELCLGEAGQEDEEEGQDEGGEEPLLSLFTSSLVR